MGFIFVRESELGLCVWLGLLLAQGSSKMRAAVCSMAHVSMRMQIAEPAVCSRRIAMQRTSSRCVVAALLYCGISCLSYGEGFAVAESSYSR